MFRTQQQSMEQSIASFSNYSVSQVWLESESQNESVKLILPDLLLNPFYLPPNRMMNREKQAIREERARVREKYLINRDLNTETYHRTMISPNIPQVKLNAVEQSIGERLLKPYTNPEALENLKLRVKQLESRKQHEESIKRIIRPVVLPEEPQTSRSQEDTVNVSKVKFSQQHLLKCRVAKARKQESESKKYNKIIAELDSRLEKCQSEKAQRQMFVKFEIDKVTRWATILCVLKMTLNFKEKVESIRQEKQRNGQPYIAAIIIQRSWRDYYLWKQGKTPITRAKAKRVTLHPSHFANGLENLRALLAVTDSKLTERTQACNVILSFLRASTYCFRGYVKRYIVNIIRLQRIIRKHLAVNQDRLNALILLFDRAIPPLLGHIRIVMTGRCLSTKDLSEAEQNAINRMCQKVSADSLKVIAEMNTASFHAILSTKYSFDIKKYAKQLKTRETVIDVPVKRRILLDYLYKSRRISSTRRHENEFRVQIPLVSMEEVRDFIHNRVDDPMCRNIQSMLQVQDLVRGGVKKLCASNTFYNMVFSVTPDIAARLYFECREMEDEHEIRRMHMSRKIGSMTDDYFDNFENDGAENDNENNNLMDESATFQRASSRKYSRKSSRHFGIPDSAVPSSEARKMSMKQKNHQQHPLDGLSDNEISSDIQRSGTEISGDLISRASVSSRASSKFEPKRPSISGKPSSSSSRLQSSRKFSSSE